VTPLFQQKRTKRYSETDPSWRRWCFHKI